MNKYAKPIPKGLTSLDVYDVLIMFDVRDPCYPTCSQETLGLWSTRT